MATKKWGKEDDAKLFALFRQPTNGLDPNQTDLKSFKAAHQRFFPEREYKNFAPLYRKKCSEFLLESELSGTRKRSKCNGLSCYSLLTVIIHALISYCCRYPGAEDDDNDSEEEDEDDDEDDEREFQPIDPNSNKMPPKKTTTAGKEKKSDGTVDGISSGVSNMNVSSFKPWELAFAGPYMVKSFMHNNIKGCQVDV